MATDQMIRDYHEDEGEKPDWIGSGKHVKKTELNHKGNPMTQPAMKEWTVVRHIMRNEPVRPGVENPVFDHEARMQIRAVNAADAGRIADDYKFKAEKQRGLHKGKAA